MSCNREYSLHYYATDETAVVIMGNDFWIEPLSKPHRSYATRQRVLMSILQWWRIVKVLFVSEQALDIFNLVLRPKTTVYIVPVGVCTIVNTCTTHPDKNNILLSMYPI